MNAAATEDRPEEAEAPPARSLPWLRIGALLVVVGVIWAILHQTGALEGWTVESLRATVQSAGWTGVLIFSAAFIIGLLANMPGMLFATVAVLAYGRVAGPALAFGAGMLGITVNFLLARSLAGRAFTAMRHPLARRLLDGVERRPVVVTAVLRVFFQFATPVSYALALSPVRLRDYLIGSAVGLASVMTVFGLALDAWIS
ncbi:MAG: TVP38/TMEM64 family protein [Myxococcales bacterium]|nr:TVP38/TMEM64 family protein [Myxococcales bacterium]